MVQRKPIGNIGQVSLSGAEVNWNKIRFPENKVAQETKITTLFVDTIARAEEKKFELKKLPEAIMMPDSSMELTK